MYSINTASILIFMGYLSDSDFTCYKSSTGIIINWFHADPKPTEQDILDNELSWAKDAATLRVKIVASSKVAAIYPFIDPEIDQALGLYDLVSDIYLSVKAASRLALSGRLLEFKNIYDAAVDAIAVISSMTDVQLVKDYDAVNAPAWP